MISVFIGASAAALLADIVRMPASFSAARAQCDDVGSAVGSAVGRDDGSGDGADVGSGDGAAVGGTLGPIVGGTERAGDGADEGGSEMLGAAVGWSNTSPCSTQRWSEYGALRS